MSNLAGALIGGAASIGGTIASYNAAMNQNAEARRQFDESMRFAKYQYADMKRYNSPQNQLRLMRQAGINPALAMSQLPSSAAVGSSAPGATASMVQPDFSGLDSVAEIASQYALRNSEEAANYAGASSNLQDSIGKQIDNAWKTKNYKLAYHLQENQRDLSDLEVNFQTQIMDSRLKRYFDESVITNANQQMALVSAAYSDKEHAAQLKKLGADTALAYANRHLTYKQASEVVRRTISSFGMSDEDAYDLYDATMDAIDASVDNAHSQSYGNWSKGITTLNIPTSVGTYQMGEAVNRQVEHRRDSRARKAARNARALRRNTRWPRP